MKNDKQTKQINKDVNEIKKLFDSRIKEIKESQTRLKKIIKQFQENNVKKNDLLKAKKTNQSSSSFFLTDVEETWVPNQISEKEITSESCDKEVNVDIQQSFVELLYKK